MRKEEGGRMNRRAQKSKGRMNRRAQKSKGKLGGFGLSRKTKYVLQISDKVLVRTSSQKLCVIHPSLAKIKRNLLGGTGKQFRGEICSLRKIDTNISRPLTTYSYEQMCKSFESFIPHWLKFVGVVGNFCSQRKFFPLSKNDTGHSLARARSWISVQAGFFLPSPSTVTGDAGERAAKRKGTAERNRTSAGKLFRQAHPNLNRLAQGKFLGKRSQSWSIGLPETYASTSVAPTACELKQLVPQYLILLPP